ncbi:MAG: MarR family transcriptional regulator [Clostridia bacterium]|nr:MarR family transcriptional regulator [Clostridia bacterium]MBQ3662777.1 MarR family transcriptional regulator [Clostridia bacterium]
MERYDPLKLDNQLCFPLYAASREVIKQYHPLLSELDITYTQYVALMVLWENVEISAKELGNRLHLDSGTLTPLLKSLEKKGLITRRRSEEDERVLMVRITKEGEALKEKALDIPFKMASCIRLDRQEAAELHRLLYKVMNSF